jgi:hypothetical protein
MRQKKLVRVVGGILTAGLLCSVPFLKGDENNGTKNFKYSIALLGDQPYSPATTAGVLDPESGKTGRQQIYPSPAYNNMIADINNARVAFSVHIGDIKEGNTLCNNNVYRQNLALFNSFADPVVYLPGDNEWTDCHRATNGVFDPLERLTYLRKTFYTSDGDVTVTTTSLGARQMNVTRQSYDLTSATNPLVENVRWVHGVVLFVGINMPGSNNNHQQPSAGSEAEYAARNALNLTWLNESFEIAANDPTIKGVMVLAQANPFERFVEPGQGYTESGYAAFITNLRANVLALKKPTAYVHGDTHYWRVDKALMTNYPSCPVPAACVPILNTAAAAGSRIYNLTRHEVFAQNDVHWTQVHIDPQNPNIFVFEPRLVAANLAP